MRVHQRRSPLRVLLQHLHAPMWSPTPTLEMLYTLPSPYMMRPLLLMQGFIKSPPLLFLPTTSILAESPRAASPCHRRQQPSYSNNSLAQGANACKTTLQQKAHNWKVLLLPQSAIIHSSHLLIETRCVALPAHHKHKLP